MFVSLMTDLYISVVGFYLVLMMDCTIVIGYVLENMWVCGVFFGFMDNLIMLR